MAIHSTTRFRGSFHGIRGVMVSIWGRPEARAAILQVREMLVKRVVERMMSPMQASFGVHEIWGRRWPSWLL